MNNTDPLTGLLTANAFLEQLDSMARSGEPLYLVVLDLDHFLTFNEKYGHVAGDAWLKVIGGLFASALAGETTLISRYGGDEFMAALRAKDLFEVYQKAEALRAQIASGEQTILVDGKEVRPRESVTMGLAAFPANASDVYELIEKGNQALTRAKISGRNQVVFYQETDTLTGLLNSYASQRALQELLAAARQKGEPLSVFLMDIDQFKDVNDEHGHRAGDEVLKRLAHILKSNFAEIGAIGRMHGDEFVVILPGQHAETTFILAEEVRRLVEGSQIDISMGSGASARAYALHFQISGGIATYPSDATERVDLLRKAGEALYRSKHMGRNRISLPASSQMVTKTSYYTQIQLERLAALARKQDKTEAFLLREALDDLLRKFGEKGEEIPAG